MESWQTAPGATTWDDYVRNHNPLVIVRRDGGQTDRVLLERSINESPTISYVFPNEVARVSQSGYPITEVDIAQNRIFLQEDTNALWRPTGAPGAVVWQQVGAATAATQQWQTLAIANSPATITHDNLRIIDLTGTTTTAPMILNIEATPLLASQRGETIICDAIADTWSTGFLEVRVSNGGNPVTTTVQDSTGTTTIAADGIVRFEQENLRGRDVKLRYIGATGQMEIRYNQ